MNARGGRRLCASAPDGVAVVAVILWTTVTAALAAALILVTVLETTISGRHRDGMDAFYAADAALQIAISELTPVANWDAVLDGTLRSAYSDGAPAGTRRGPAGSIDLDRLTAMLRCGKESGCSDADITAITSDRPWGVSNPRWQLFLNAPLRAVVPADTSPAYVLVWVADDPSDSDGDPLRDGAAVDNPGRGRIVLIAQAHGAGGARRTIQATIARAGAGLRMVTWREMI